MRLKNRITGAVIGFGIALVAMPIAFMVTILLVPFWSLLEATTGVESLGHSGPAEWCYLVIYVLVVGCSGWMWWLQRKK